MKHQQDGNELDVSGHRSTPIETQGSPGQRRAPRPWGDGRGNSAGLPEGWPTHAQLYRFARRLTTDHHEAEALSSATIADALRDAQRGRSISPQGLFKIARHRWVDERRRAAHTMSVPLDDQPRDLSVFATDEAEDASEIAARREAVELLFENMKTLPDDQRRVLELYYFKDLSDAQIALELGQKEGWARSKRLRGIATLKARLTKPDGQLPAALIAVAEAARNIEAAAAGSLHGGRAAVRIATRAGGHASSSALAARIALVFVLLAGLAAGLMVAHQRKGSRDGGALLAGLSRMQAKPDDASPEDPSVASRTPAELDAAAATPPPAAPAEQRPAAAQGARTFEIQLFVDGAPADASWVSMAPMLDPEPYRAAGAPVPSAVSYTAEPDEEGVYSYELVDAVVPWLFSIRSGEFLNCQVCVVDSGFRDARRVVHLELGSIHVPKATAEKLALSRVPSIAMVQLDDSVWAMSLATPVVEKKVVPHPSFAQTWDEETATVEELGEGFAVGDLLFTQVAVGSAAISSTMAEGVTVYPETWSRRDAMVVEVVKGQRLLLDLE